MRTGVENVQMKHGYSQVRPSTIIISISISSFIETGAASTEQYSMSYTHLVLKHEEASGIASYGALGTCPLDFQQFHFWFIKI